MYVMISHDAARPIRPVTNDTIVAELLTPATESEWRDYTAAQPQSTFFHELSYRRAVERAYGHRPMYFLARRGGDICGVLPMFLIDSRLTGRMLVSMPYAIYGGPLADDAQTENCLRRAAEHAAAVRGANIIEWRTVAVPASDVSNSHAQPSNWRRVNSHVTFRRALPNTADAVAAWLPRKARAAARRASERNRLEVTWEVEDWPTVWELYSRSMRRLGSINYTQRFFELLVAETVCGDSIPTKWNGDSASRSLSHGTHLDHRNLERKHGSEIIVQVVRSEGKPVAGLLTFVHRGVAMPYFVGLDERADIYGLSNHLYFTLMQKAVELECHTFDFGRSRIDNAGSCDFKRFHGFEPTPLAYERFVARGARDTRLTPSNPRFALARRVWPHLPLGVTQRLGGWLSRSIPG